MCLKVITRMAVKIAAVVLALVIAGCAADGDIHKETGSLECVGYCSLVVDKSKESVSVNSSGTKTETRDGGGLINQPIDNPENYND